MSSTIFCFFVFESNLLIRQRFGLKSKLYKKFLFFNFGFSSYHTYKDLIAIFHMRSERNILYQVFCSLIVCTLNNCFCFGFEKHAKPYTHCFSFFQFIN